jgi:hypothetical protein
VSDRDRYMAEWVRTTRKEMEGTPLETTTSYREIDGTLLTAALSEAFGINNIFTPADNQDVSEDLVRALVEHLEETDMVCDHSVNICVCHAKAVHESLKLWLDGKRLCPVCGGEGFRFVGYDAEYDIEMNAPCPRYVVLP